jgi:hypothetical protein
MKPFTITMHPGANVQRASAQLARLIIDRWMPDNAGGVHMLINPRLASSLSALWQQVNMEQKAKSFRVGIYGNVPNLVEINE